MRCIFCNNNINPVNRLNGAGRLAICEFCCEKLEGQGILKLHKDEGIIESSKSLMEIILTYSSL